VSARQSRVSVGSALTARGCSDVNVLSARTLFTAGYGIFSVGGAKGGKVRGSVDTDT